MGHEKLRGYFTSPISSPYRNPTHHIDQTIQRRSAWLNTTFQEFVRTARVWQSDVLVEIHMRRVLSAASGVRVEMAWAWLLARAFANLGL